MASTLNAEGIVGVFQPTSPSRTATSIRRAVEEFRSSGATSLASVVRNNHLHWYSEQGAIGDARPLFAARVNRQFAQWALYQETGAIQLIAAEAIRNRPEMVSGNHMLFEVPPSESLDIDTPADLVLARREASHGTIVFRVRANRTVGSGHLHHCLQVADELIGHRTQFLLVDSDPFAADLLDAAGHDWRHETDLATDLLGPTGPRVVVNDVLDTSVEEVLEQRSLGYRVVSIEDLGPGARHADWVVNALYPPNFLDGPSVETGPRWATLRPEFSGLPPKNVRTAPERILVTFGGTDPSGLAARTARLLATRTDLAIRVIVGPGAEDADFPSRCDVLRSARNMATEMLEADVVMTSAGRTVYEAAATGTPVVAVAQNAREASHVHLDYRHGVIFAGIGALLGDDAIVDPVLRLLDQPQLRRELSERLSKVIDHRGSRRIAHGIERLLEGLD